MDIKEEFLYWGKRLYEGGYSPGTSGNMSVRTENGMFISSSGCCLGDMDETDIVFVDYKGKSEKGAKKPSMEKNMHLKIYALRKDIGAIFHCHSPKLSAFAMCAKPLREHCISEMVFHFGEIPCAPYAMPSSDRLAETTSEYFLNFDTVLMANHGAISGADTLKNAFYKVETAENYAASLIDAYIIGKPKNLSQKNISDILQLRK